MHETDPLRKIEQMVEELHTHAGKYTTPVRKRYPLLFASLLTISATAIFQGLEIIIQSSPILREHPVVLIMGGFGLLLITGGLYRALQQP